MILLKFLYISDLETLSFNNISLNIQTLEKCKLWVKDNIIFLYDSFLNWEKAEEEGFVNKPLYRYILSCTFIQTYKDYYLESNTLSLESTVNV